MRLKAFSIVVIILVGISLYWWSCANISIPTSPTVSEAVALAFLILLSYFGIYFIGDTFIRWLLK